jgi:hypothetical protein
MTHRFIERRASRRFLPIQRRGHETQLQTLDLLLSVVEKRRPRSARAMSAVIGLDTVAGWREPAMRDEQSSSGTVPSAPRFGWPADRSRPRRPARRPSARHRHRSASRERPLHLAAGSRARQLARSGMRPVPTPAYAIAPAYEREHDHDPPAPQTSASTRKRFDRKRKLHGAETRLGRIANVPRIGRHQDSTLIGSIGISARGRGFESRGRADGL